MSGLGVLKTAIEGVVILEPVIHGDQRGYFMETYNERDYDEAGIRVRFVQDNQSKSKKGVLRGLHYQVAHPQSKLLRVVSGEVFDVAVDIREGSPTFGQYVSCVLTAENHKQIFIPKGLAHGFLVLSDSAEIQYKCDDFYHPEGEGGILWNDPTIGVQWPVLDVPYLLSEKDKKNPLLGDRRIR